MSKKSTNLTTFLLFTTAAIFSFATPYPLSKVAGGLFAAAALIYLYHAFNDKTPSN